MKNIHQHIIDKCQRGDSKAQFELYRLYCKAMYNVSLQLLSNELEAEDVVQESFLKAFAMLHQYNESVTFGAWLKRIVINQSIDHLRKKKLDMADSKDEGLPEMEEDVMWSEDIDYERLHDAMAQLPEKHRVVFSLFVLEGYDHEEIAEILQINYSTSRSHLARAKIKLKQLLIGRERLVNI
ncbi:MAG: RNA polymerase sigma factor [Mangrovibacterium sp.]